MFKFVNLLNFLGIPDKNTFEIMRLANFLKMTPITEGCEEILKKKMDFSNCIPTWKFAKREHFENLRSISFEYARQNYEKVFSFQFT